MIYTLQQAEAIRERAMTFGFTRGHVSVRLAAAGVIDHLDGWEGFDCADEELAEAIEPLRAVYADLLDTKALAA